MSCLDMEREHIENVIKMHAEVGKNGYSPYIDEITGTWFVFDDISRKYVDTNIKARGANSWEDIDGKPESFPPSEHNHDDRYYTSQDVDMQIQNLGMNLDMQIQNLGRDVDVQMQNLRNEIPSLDGYATESWVERRLMKEYELLVDQTLIEDVNEVSFYLSGIKTFDDIYILCQSPPVPKAFGCTWREQNGEIIGYWLGNTFSTSTTRCIISHSYNIYGAVRICETFCGTNTSAILNPNKSIHDISAGINRLSTSGNFLTGTRFRIWGQ